jgi:hypothetical protein
MTLSTAARPVWHDTVDGRKAWVESTPSGYLVHYSDGTVSNLKAL